MADTHVITNASGSAVLTLGDAGVVKLVPLADGWAAPVPGGQPGTFVETMEVKTGSSDTTAIASIEMVARLDHLAKSYHDDPTNAEPVYYQRYGDSLTAQQAIVYECNYTPIPRAMYDPLLGNSGVSFGALQITRGTWEGTADVSLYAGGPGDFGGTALLSNTYIGSAGSRITEAGVYGSMDNATNPITDMWLGIKPLGAGYTSFQSVWNLHAGTVFTDASVYDDSSGFSPGSGPVDTNVIKVTFATDATMVKRCSITVKDLSLTNPGHMAGEYIVIGRMRSDAGTCVYNVEMKSTYASMLYITPPVTPHGEVTYDTADYLYDNGENYQALELGKITIPASGYSELTPSQYYIKGFELQFWAERVSGSGNLLLDSLCMIPARHYLKMTGGYSYYVAGVPEGEPASYSSTRYTQNLRGQGRAIVAAYDGTEAQFSLASNVAAFARDWRVPAGGGLLVFCGTGRLQSIHSSLTTGVELVTRKRWGFQAS